MSATPFFVFVLLSKSTRRIPERKGGKVSEPGSHVGALLLLAPFRVLWWCPPRLVPPKRKVMRGMCAAARRCFFVARSVNMGRKTRSFFRFRISGRSKTPTHLSPFTPFQDSQIPCFTPLLFKRKSLTGAGGNRKTFSISRACAAK